jgi:penicillin-binding protein 1A
MAVGTVMAVSLWYTLWPLLPDVDTLREVQLQTPLRVYSRDGKLIREFGEKRRVPLTVDQVPDPIKNALIATEDSNFRTHIGVDPAGIARAVLHIIREGRKGPGGSTITMQVARNFFLDRGKTYTRKLKEIMLALKIERELSKDEIIELYLNKIFLGHRAYGVGAAAQVYYGKRINELSLAQMAMIAGLPQRPSDFNPVTNPDKALKRRNHVLWRLKKENYIGEEAYVTARIEPLTAELHASPIQLSAPYMAEMARRKIKAGYGNKAFSAGLNVYTTIDATLQSAADAALRKALIAYDRRHGWRGAELQLTPAQVSTNAEDSLALDRLLVDVPRLGELPPAVVLAITDKTADVHIKRIGTVTLPWSSFTWARPFINNNRVGKKPKKVADVLNVGDVVRVQQVTNDKGDKFWRLSQLPEVEGALVAVDPRSGAIVALSGGFDFRRSKFNRVTQAQRQPGSAFKPFIYSAALDKGYTAASTINDAPIVFDDPGLEAAWRPENYSGKSYGPTRLRFALTKSRNLVSIRLLRNIGIEYALEHVQRFGIKASKLPRDLSLSLGSGAVTPLEIATGYSVLANGGFEVTPFVIQRIEDKEGNALYEANPKQVCAPCAPVESSEGSENLAVSEDTNLAPRTLSAENAWLMYSMMRDVITAGTARKALKLKRKDLAGKTGTTNDQRDAWFSGFNQNLVATAWVGFDKVAPMGRAETGGKAALPMWIDFMGAALQLEPYKKDAIPSPPVDLISVRIDAETGLLATSATDKTMREFFRPDHAPNRNDKLRAAAAAASAQKEAKDLSEKIW